MREIKFRIWQEWTADDGSLRNGRMITSNHPKAPTWGNPRILIDPFSGELVELELDDLSEGAAAIFASPLAGILTIEPFIGYYDCNGTKIFQGDLMRHPVFFRNTVRPVEWSDGTWNIDGRRCSTLDLSEGEVVGNIHQNREFWRVTK